MGAVEELQQAVATVAEKAGPSVVGIGGGWGQGSGVVVAEGKVLTNAHNVRGDEVTVVFGDGRTATAQVAAADLDGDLAVLSVDTAGAPAIEWPKDAAAPGVGAPVFALSNRGGRGLRVTFGLVSSVGRGFRGPRGRRIAGSIEHTAPLAHGSSGGPVVDAAGRFLALNTNRAGEGFYLALPADAELARRVEALGQGKSPFRPHLGIGIKRGEKSFAGIFGKLLGAIDARFLSWPWKSFVNRRPLNGPKQFIRVSTSVFGNDARDADRLLTDFLPHWLVPVDYRQELGQWRRR